MEFDPPAAVAAREDAESENVHAGRGWVGELLLLHAVAATPSAMTTATDCFDITASNADDLQQERRQRQRRCVPHVATWYCAIVAEKHVAVNGKFPFTAAIPLASTLLSVWCPFTPFERGDTVRPITTILVPTDFSSSSAEALDYARRVAVAFGASLHLMHVIENPVVYGMYAEVYTGLPPGYLDGLDKAARTRLEAQLTPEEKDRFNAAFITRIGTPSQEILDYLAAHPEVGLVVMATAGRSGVARFVMGSVADKIVRGAPCPVMTVHPQHHGDSHGSTIAA